MADRILVVEDDDQVRDVLLRFLQREGYAPQPASSGEEALSLVRMGPPEAAHANQ